MTTCEVSKVRGPVAGTCANPVVGMRADEMRPVRIGVTIESTGPQNPRGLLVCRVNGEWLSRASWQDVTRAGDVIEWYDLPKDRDILRTVLFVAAAVFLPAFLSGPQLFFATLAANVAINALLPPVGPEVPNRPGETGQSLSTSLQGNVARLDEPIAKICGHREVTPNFAGYPYFEFRPKPDAEDPNLDNDQYYLALLCVGIGNHEVIPKIGNTPLSRFDDVVRATYLPPGTLPTEVLANVQTAPEVSGLVLESGIYSGGFVACSPMRTCAELGIDVSATRGLGKEAALTVEWRVEVRQINDFGQILTPWSVLANESRTAFTSTPQRWSFRYVVTPARYEVRLVRTDVKDTSPQALHEIAWLALRGYLAEPAPLNQNAAHFEVVLRASSQLSQSASQQIRLIVDSFTRTWSPGGGWTAQDVKTRNPFWWALELLTSQTWGMRKTDDRIDLQSFYALALQADERQDHFDFAFTSTMDGWEALQMILRAGRARAFRRNGVISVARDEIADAPVTAFTPRNCKPKIQIEERHPTTKTPDGVIVEYEDHRTWEWTPIECPLPGVSLSEMQNPIRMRLDGVVGATHALREGLYEAAVLAYRTKRETLITEMEGVLPAYMSPVTVIPDVKGYGQTGDIVQWDAGTLTAILSEPPDFTNAPIYLTLVRGDGTLTDPIAVSPGTEYGAVVLAGAPDFTIETQDGTRERTKFLLGTLEGSADLLRVASITDGGTTQGGAQLYEIAGVVDDDRVHEADIAYLPGPGDIQDPIGYPDDSDEGGGTTAIIIDLVDKTGTKELNKGVGPDFTTGTQIIVYRLENDGRLYTDPGPRVGLSHPPAYRAGEWSKFRLLEVSEAGLFEAYFEVLSSTFDPAAVTITGTFNTWQSLATNREFGVQAVDVTLLPPAGTSGQFATVRVRIREISTGIEQDTCLVYMVLTYNPPGGGD